MTEIIIENLTHPLLSPMIGKHGISFFSRLRGLMFTRNLDNNSALLMEQQIESRINSSIHMFFMNYDILVIWANSEKIIVDTTLAKRWHPFYAPKSAARFIIEAHPGRLSEFQIGDHLDF